MEPDRWVPEALRLLRGRFRAIQTSSLYDSVPEDCPPGTPSFVNLALRLQTDCSLPALQEVCRRIEERCLRRRSLDRYAPRTLDLDVAYHCGGAAAYASDDLSERAFVLLPAAEIWPDLLLEGSGVRLGERARRLKQAFHREGALPRAQVARVPFP